VIQAQAALDKARVPYTQYDIAQQQHAVAAAQAALDKAQNPYTDQDLQTAQAGVEQAQAALGLAQKGVTDTDVTAPVDGQVLTRDVSPGALVGTSSPIVELVPPGLQIGVDIDESQISHVANGQVVDLTVPAYPGQVFHGTVTAIAPAVDPRSRTVHVVVNPSDPNGELLSGMLASVNIVTAQDQSALLIPRAAITGAATPGTQTTIVSIDDNGRINRTAIQLGIVNDNVAQVAGGLAEGQLVATGNTAGLNTGEVVTPQIETRTALAR
jgi:membrane fusion protein (multidrug efflux system)